MMFTYHVDACSLIVYQRGDRRYELKQLRSPGLMLCAPSFPRPSASKPASVSRRDLGPSYEVSISHFRPRNWSFAVLTYIPSFVKILYVPLGWKFPWIWPWPSTSTLPKMSSGLTQESVESLKSSRKKLLTKLCVQSQGGFSSETL